MIGLRFATESGLVLKMGQYQDKDQVMKFECAPFSCFAEERETLFFGGDTVLRIKGILQWAEGRWMTYDKYMEPINAFSRMMDGFSVRNQPISNRKRDQKVMTRIIRDIFLSLIFQQGLSETPRYIRDLVEFHHSAATRVQQEGPAGHIMNIVVCVKYVPDATADRKFEEDNTVDRVGVDGLLSELDEYAVEQALQQSQAIAVREMTRGGYIKN